MKTQVIMAFCALITIQPLSAQVPENQAYAITSKSQGDFEWTEVKLINLDNGSVINNVFESSKGNNTVLDANTSQPITQPTSGDPDHLRPFAGLSAACAFDSQRKRLYYSPMFINQLRYIDFSGNQPRVYILQDKTLTNASDMNVEEDHITRMVIGADGNGYALNNGGNRLVRFTTGDVPVLTQLGSLRDAATNGDVSVRNPNTSWGGDLIADTSGNLLLITARNYVFKINVTDRVATYIAQIKNLPIGFTTNGAAVCKDGKIVLSSANFLNGYFSVDPVSWTSSPLPVQGHVFNTSDLANSNLLHKPVVPLEEDPEPGPEPVEPPAQDPEETPPAQEPEENPTIEEPEEEPADPPAPVHSSKITIFPNPVKTNAVKIRFENVQGKFSIEMMDIVGRMISHQWYTVAEGGQTTEIRLSSSLSRGVYVVRLLNHDRNEVFLKRIILQ